MEFEVLKKIGYILRFYRRAKGFSQQEMANVLGVSPRNFQRLEMGEVEPRLETLVRIAQALDIQVSSLVRNTDEENLSMSDVSTYCERSMFRELEQRTQASAEDLKFAERVIAKDRQILPDNQFEASMSGNTVTLSDASMKLLELPLRSFDTQSFVMLGCPAERWEFAFRHNLRSAVLENIYKFPNGIKMLQSYHYEMDPNPDSPKSKMNLRDISGRHNLEAWLKNFKEPIQKERRAIRGSL